MADTERIKRNLHKMLAANAPETDMDAYLKTEGFNSAEEWRAASAAPAHQAQRLVGQFAQNVNDSLVANTVGAPVDLVAAGLRKVGVPVDNPVGGSESIKKGIDYVATLPGRVGDAVSQGSLSPFTEDRTSRFDPINRQEKIAAGVGQGTGAVLSTMLPAAAVANTARAGTVTQGVAQSLASQPGAQLASGVAAGGVTGATDDPLLGLAAGVATPLAIAMGRGLVSPTTNRLTPQEQRLVTAAQNEGIPLTPAQQTGSPTLRSVEETMAKLPLSSGPMQNTYRGQKEAFNRAVLARAGVTADDASPETLTRAFQTAGQQFDDLAARTTINADNQLAADVQRVATNYGRRLETDVAPVFQSYMDDIAPLLQATQAGANPQIPGEVYRTIRSDITTRMRQTNNIPLRNALGQLVETLDDAVERSTSGSLRGEWQEARRQYQALMTIDKAMQGGTQAGRSSADIPYGALKGAVQSGDRQGYARGRGQLNELSRVGDYLADKIPDSGTVGRGLAANLVTGGALFGGGAATGIGLPAAAAAAATPWALSRAYNTPLVRAYLTNQVAGNTDLASLYGAEAVRRALESGNEGSSTASLARALRRANEKRQGAGR